MKESYTFSCLVSILGGIVIGVLIFVLAQPIVHVFNSEADAEVLSIGILCIRLQCIALPLHALNSIVNMYYAGTGREGRALLINISRQGYCLRPERSLPAAGTWCCVRMWRSRKALSSI